MISGVFVVSAMFSGIAVRHLSSHPCCKGLYFKGCHDDELLV